MKTGTGQVAVALAMTGASGAQYGLTLLGRLLAAGRQVHLMVSKPALIVIGSETDEQVPGRAVEIERYFSARFGAEPGQLRAYGQEEWSACVASGSGAPRAMVVCPCSMATLSSIAVGASRNLIERAADVMLKAMGRSHRPRTPGIPPPGTKCRDSIQIPFPDFVKEREAVGR